MTLHAVTVLGHDRAGIIAQTTGILADLGLNIDDSTMTLLRGQFAMMLIVDGSASLTEIEQALAPLTSDGTLDVTVREVPDEHAAATGSSYVLSVHGRRSPRHRIGDHRPGRGGGRQYHRPLHSSGRRALCAHLRV